MCSTRVLPVDDYRTTADLDGLARCSVAVADDAPSAEQQWTPSPADLPSQLFARMTWDRAGAAGCGRGAGTVIPLTDDKFNYERPPAGGDRRPGFLTGAGRLSRMMGELVDGSLD